MIRILFVTWDAPEATYLEGLFLPAFAGLGRQGFAFDVLQFRWGEEGLAARVAARCETAGIGYRAAWIDRRGGAAGPLLSAWRGGAEVRAAMRQFQSDWVMPRSLFAGIAVLASRSSAPMLFECDGFAADERAEFGGWGHGLRYRALRSVERRLARRATVSVVRTEAARTELARRADVAPNRIFTVTNGRDPALFKPLDPGERARRRAALGIDPATTLLVHAGSVGPQYGLARIDPLFAALDARDLRPRLLLLSGGPAGARAALSASAPRAARDALFEAVPADRVGEWLALADAGLAFREASLSMRAVAPVKLAEYLLCGLPVIGSTLAGDPVEAGQAGLLFDQERGAEAAASWLAAQLLDRPAVAMRARALARSRYSLDRMVADYARAMALMRDLVQRGPRDA